MIVLCYFLLSWIPQSSYALSCFATLVHLIRALNNPCTAAAALVSSETCGWGLWPPSSTDVQVLSRWGRIRAAVLISLCRGHGRGPDARADITRCASPRWYRGLLGAFDVFSSSLPCWKPQESDEKSTFIPGFTWCARGLSPFLLCSCSGFRMRRAFQVLLEFIVVEKWEKCSTIQSDGSFRCSFNDLPTCWAVYLLRLGVFYLHLVQCARKAGALRALEEIPFPVT